MTTRPAQRSACAGTQTLHGSAPDRREIARILREHTSCNVGSVSHELHCYEYVNRPFPSVRAAILSDALRFVAPATAEAGERAHVLARHLSVMIAGFEIGKDIDVVVERVDLHTDAPGHLAPEALEIDLTWKARTQTGLFPVMNAKLLAYPLSPYETQLDFTGVYAAPGGPFGAIADRVVGQRIAEATAHRFVEEVKTRLAEVVPA